MTGKQRMLTALARGKPDRLPTTIHQWQAYHLQHYMGGIDQIEAFRVTGLDASVMPWPMYIQEDSPHWRCSSQELGRQGGETFHRQVVETPGGTLTCETGSNAITTYHTQYLAKTAQDVELFLRYFPPSHLDRAKVAATHERTGDLGIVRGFLPCYGQPGIWQDFCALVGTQQAIFWAMDDSAFVHHVLATFTRWRVQAAEELAGSKFDLIEHGGGAASSSVISPAMFDEFCVPYDRQAIDAIHAVGLPVAYHTCGGMMALLDRIAANGCDASETLSPVGVGGDIRSMDRTRVRDTLGARVALIGGIDQHHLLTQGTPAQIEADVRHCFETLGRNGGYICSASDHFFDAPVVNLKALAHAARSCCY